MKKKGKVVSHTDIVVDGQGFNIALHQDPAEGVWLMNMRPDTPSEKAESVAMRFWKTMRTGDGWGTLKDAKLAIERAIRNMKARWNGWHRETYD